MISDDFENNIASVKWRGKKLIDVTTNFSFCIQKIKLTKFACLQIVKVICKCAWKNNCREAVFLLINNMELRYTFFKKNFIRK